ncbi:hypothetical protein [Dokdonia sp. Hel_I_53]|uniref:hypothetical protein n=1 Tax=Dokdonia sp. Hel_I_53 TaxID=1566287 RepID=UPI00119959FD|nr:hypothetical protein [Dokdonia sp. Hel_I_53]TVZ51645.1 hypothetical protein OD90_0793 [Dokdonia sp. Hel_I_53]
MHLLKRIAFYLGGFSIGLILLAFFFSGKKTSCAYFPEARVLKQLRAKPYTMTQDVTSSLTTLQLDTVTINRMLKVGDVDFGESETRREPCGHYVIYGDSPEGTTLKMELENCLEEVQIISLNTAD